MLPVGILPIGTGSGASSPAIKNSLRLRPAAGSKLTRTFGTPTNATTYTGSMWVRLCGVSPTSAYMFFDTEPGGGASAIHYGISANKIGIANNGAGYTYGSPLYRDPSAWAHLCFNYNGTTFNVWVNNVSILSTAYAMGAINTAIAHCIGGRVGQSGYELDGSIAQVCFVDGQALTPSTFAFNDPSYGNEWKPKTNAAIIAGVGNFGNNGCLLDFHDTTNTTTLCYDVSGKGNHWTPSGISLTAGPTYDALIDSPCNGSGGTQPVGCYATLNPVANFGAATLSEANLKTAATSGYFTTQSTFTVSSGKWYWEVVANGPTYTVTGVAKVGSADITTSGRYLGQSSDAWSVFIEGSASVKKYTNNTATAFSPTLSAVANDVLMVALDADNGKIFFGKNGTWGDSADPAAGTNAAYTGMTGPFVPSATTSSSQTSQYNFGQRPFAYTPPTGFKALCTANLTSTTVTTSGAFTGNVSTDGPTIQLNGAPVSMTINGNAVTFGTHADKLATGFKVRSSSASYNASGSNTYSITSAGQPLKYANAQGNP